jgi:hypothetical protein
MPLCVYEQKQDSVAAATNGDDSYVYVMLRLVVSGEIGVSILFLRWLGRKFAVFSPEKSPWHKIYHR